MLMENPVETKVSSSERVVVISGAQPTVLIGERINPSGKKTLSDALLAGDLTILREYALEQKSAGADILDVNVGVTGVDEAALLPRAVREVMGAVDLPLCIDSSDPKALENALKIYQGKPLINSITGDERSFNEILPVVKDFNAAVIGLTMDDRGIPDTVEGRVRIAGTIIERAERIGMPREDIVIDCLAMSVGADMKAGLVTLESVRRVRVDFGVNCTLGASNISFGLPHRGLINAAFLAMTIAAGVSCPIVDVSKVRPVVLASDLLLGRDKFASRFVKLTRNVSDDVTVMESF